MEKRRAVWETLSASWKGDNLDRGVKESSIEEILDEVKKMLNSQLIGRVILKHFW